jgi:hypothetical protein
MPHTTRQVKKDLATSGRDLRSHHRGRASVWVQRWSPGQSRRAEPDDRHRVTSIDLTTLSDGADQGERARSRLVCAVSGSKLIKAMVVRIWAFCMSASPAKTGISPGASSG